MNSHTFKIYITNRKQNFYSLFIRAFRTSMNENDLITILKAFLPNQALTNNELAVNML